MDKPLVIYDIGIGNKQIETSEPLPPLPEIPQGAIVVISGRAPVWRYGMAFHKLHGSPAAVIATYDPRAELGAVVVASHSPEYHEGQTIDIDVD